MIKFKRNVLRSSKKVVNGGRSGKLQKFDERKFEDANNIEEIVIDSTIAKINVLGCDSSKVEVHFYGQAIIWGAFEFNIGNLNHKLKITLKCEGYCNDNDLKIDVMVPKKTTFKQITANSSSANITLDENVFADYIESSNQAGKLISSATFTNACVSTKSGDIELFIDAQSEISVDISSMSGDVLAEFKNVGNMNLSTSLMCGDVRNFHKEKTGYTANVNIRTMSGAITIS